MRDEEKQVKQATEKLGEKLQEKGMESYAKLMEKAVKKSVTPKDLLRLTDAQTEQVYAQAYRLYNNGKYLDASKLFRLLTMINYNEAKYILGMAACLHMLKEYNKAGQTYMLCSVIDPKSPIPAFHASDCYLQMKDKASALVCLEIAIEKAGKKPEYQILRDRAMLTRQTLRKDLGIKDKEPAEEKQESKEAQKS